VIVAKSPPHPNAAIYQRALARLRDKYKEEFDAIYAGMKDERWRYE
jgi:hypothetical protein